MTLAEVRQYDCGTLIPKTSPRRLSIPGTRIPTLDEVLDLAKTSNINFNIEIKSSREWKNLAPPPEELSRMVTDAVRKHKLERRVLVQSFDFRVVKAVRAIAPELKVAALYMGPQRSFAGIAQETGPNRHSAFQPRDRGESERGSRPECPGGPVDGGRARGLGSPIGHGRGRHHHQRSGRTGGPLEGTRSALNALVDQRPVRRERTIHDRSTRPHPVR